MIRVVRPGVVVLASIGAVVMASAPMAAAPVGDGMLTAKDVGLKVVSEPHTSTVIAYDLVDPATCAAGEDVEYDARVVSFAKKAGGPGPALNQVVYDLDSKGDAVAFFAELRASDQARADCGTTAKATDLAVVKGPKGVGDDRYTVTAKEQIAGKPRAVRSVSILEGDAVTELIFLDWPAVGATTKVAKKAAAHLG